jgi:hypothetical protein
MSFTIVCWCPSATYTVLKTKQTHHSEIHPNPNPHALKSTHPLVGVYIWTSTSSICPGLANVSARPKRLSSV